MNLLGYQGCASRGEDSKVRKILIGSVLINVAMSPAAIAQDALTKKGANPNQVVCKIERYVGSNLKNRVCKTRAEWKRVADDSKQGMDDRWFKDRGPPDPDMAPAKGPAAGGPGI